MLYLSTEEVMGPFRYQFFISGSGKSMTKKMMSSGGNSFLIF
jgi:hypothetical protein